MGTIQLEATFLTENWIYRYTVLKQNPLHFAMSLLSSCLQNFTLQENRMTAKLSIGGIQSNSKLGSALPNTTYKL